MKSLPLRISTTMAHSLTASYILKQTHSPVFFKDRFGSYQSNILSRWHKNLDDNFLYLCIDRPKFFSPDKYFDIDGLKNLVKMVTAKEGLSVTINSTEKNCINIELNAEATKLLVAMSELENAPTARSSDERYELGLGEFKVTEFSVEKIVLNRKLMLDDHFNIIEFIKIDGPNDKNLAALDFNDYNLIGEDLIPKEVRKNFRSVTTTTLKSNVLLLNIRDKNIRRAIFSCVDSIALSRVLYGKRFVGLNSSSLIPRGMEGAQTISKKSQCVPYTSRNSKTPSITFITWRSDNESAIQDEVEKLGRRAGVSIKTEFYSYTELTDILYHHKDRFNLLPITIDTKNGSFSQLFESFGSPEKSLLSFTVASVRREFQKLRQSQTNSGTQKTIANTLNNEILSQALAVPLFQPIKTYYYPPNIDEIFLGDDFLDFPQVARFKL